MVKVQDYLKLLYYTLTAQTTLHAHNEFVQYHSNIGVHEYMHNLDFTAMTSSVYIKDMTIQSCI